jgi:hypothetical protein
VETRRQEIDRKKAIIMAQLLQGCMACGRPTERMCPDGCGDKVCLYCRCPWRVG